MPDSPEGALPLEGTEIQPKPNNTQGQQIIFWRKSLGLPTDIPPLDLAAQQVSNMQKSEQDRQQALEDYINDESEEREVDGVITQNIKKFEEYRTKSAKARRGMPLGVKLGRLFVIGRLRQKGFSKAGEIIECLDEEYEKREGGYFYSSVLDWKIDQVTNLNKLVRPKDTVKRANSIGITTRFYSLKGQAIGDFLYELEQIPEDKFSTFLNKLNQFHFINLDQYAYLVDHDNPEGSHERIVTPSMQFNLDIAKTGGLTPEQLETLKKMDKLYLTDSTERTLMEALTTDSTVLADRETFYGELFRRGRKSTGLSLNILELERRNLISPLAEAIRKGFPLGDEFINHMSLALKETGYRTSYSECFHEKPALTDKLEETLRIANSYQEDPKLGERVNVLREALGKQELDALPEMVSLGNVLMQIEQTAASLTPEEVSKLRNLLRYTDIAWFDTDSVFTGLFFPQCKQPTLSAELPSADLIKRVTSLADGLIPAHLSHETSLENPSEGIKVFAEKFLPESQHAYWRTYADIKDAHFRSWLINRRAYYPSFLNLISTDSEGLLLYQLTKLQNNQIEQDVDAKLGKRILHLKTQGKITADDLKAILTEKQIKSTDHNLKNKVVEINNGNWQGLLHLYIAANSNNHIRFEDYYRIDEQTESAINSIFETKEAKNICLEQLSKMWFDYLSAGDPDALPLTMILTTDLAKMAGGVGNLSQVESLVMFVDALKESLSKATTVEGTKAELMKGLRFIEEKFRQEKWSNEDKSNFYDISREMLQAAPSLYTEFLSIFSTLNPNELKRFTKELYPLYKVRLSLMETTQRTFDARELVTFRRGLKEFNVKEEDDFSRERKKLLEEIRQMFSKRFGIVKIPEDFTNEHLRSVTNMSLYLSNMADKTPVKEATLSFYLALMLNNQWSSFRKGENIDPTQLLSSEKADQIRELLITRSKLDPLTTQALGLEPKDISTFQSLLQQESQHIVLGNIETIDVKLTNVIRNLEELLDEDLYPENIDKEMLGLLIKFGNKKVGAASAKMYQQLSGKQLSLTEDEREVCDQISAILARNNLGTTNQAVKEYFQDRIKPLATIVNLLATTKENKTWQKIEELQKSLNPKPNVIAIFKKLGEEFTHTSGAYALSQDLSYLENVVVKRESELSQDEKDALNAYTGGIRVKMAGLESTYAEIRKKLNNLRQTDFNNPLLTDKIADIINIVNREDVQQVITSTMTSDMNLIVENIRECLSCTKQGSNNDTDLTFGDSNKFYLYSQSEAQKGKGSLADQIAIAIPVTYADGKTGAAFVLDILYGLKTPDILLNHIQTTLVKYRSIQAKFPAITLSVLVSQAAIQSSGISTELLLERLKSLGLNCSIKPEEHIKVNVNQSAAGDHYIEFGGTARRSGERDVDGIVLRI